MGREERNRQLTIADARETLTAHKERLLGELLEFGANEECPACGREARAITGEPQRGESWCPGWIATLPAEVEQPCRLSGHHLHVKCACGYSWRTQTKTPTEGLLS